MFWGLEHQDQLEQFQSSNYEVKSGLSRSHDEYFAPHDEGGLSRGHDKHFAPHDNNSHFFSSNNENV